MGFKGFLAGVAASFLTVCGLSWVQGEPTYALIQLTTSGNEYVMDYNLTQDDCIRAKTRAEVDKKELIAVTFNCYEEPK